MKYLGYYNGTYGPLEEMKVPMNDRACYFGDGVYEATLARNGKIFALEEHLDRFYNSAGLLRMKVPYTREELTEILTSLLKEMDDSEIFVYWQLTRGTAIRIHSFPEAPVKPNLWIMMKPGAPASPSKTMKLITEEDTRFLHCNIKTLNLIPNVMAYQKAHEAGCDECVFHRGDIVTECSSCNISILKDGVFITHPTDHYILPGISRMHLIQQCKKLGIPVDERPFTVKEMMEADEVIVSSSSRLGLIASEIDGHPVGGKATELWKKVQSSYFERFDEATVL
ncbi:D-amino acid aminotransferase [Clostridium transplantifaecale]|uniref:D-amino acid aminotransferase n=1 Tax=Clostridium transplantifaecale TaxID=2479838 RepID=UPI000F6394AB|nr:D-amino acid aminotransferase [Clostridium transplantifaecale]